MKKITPKQLVAMDEYINSHPIAVHVAYAHDDNELFRERIYRKDARLWLYKDLAGIVLKASEICRERYNYTFLLRDGLRTSDAQEAMLYTKRAKDNPNWLEEPRLLSSPGAGGHPRGMAVDIELLDESGQKVDMGTVFDYMSENSSAAANPAHREYVGLTDEFRHNRSILTKSMIDAAKELNLPLLPLPEEWWDFRFPSSLSGQYEPISDSMLPPAMRMMG